MSGHFADRAAFIAALSETDPERRAAKEHASGCASCRDALEEGRRLRVLLERALPLPPPTAEALERAARIIARETAAERRRKGWARRVAAGALLAAWATQLAIGKNLDHRPRAVAVSVGALALALAGALIQIPGALALGAAIGGSGLLAYVAGATSGFAPQYGVHCALYEIAAGALSFGALSWAARRMGLALDRWDTSAVAAGGAFASQAAQHLACPVAHASAHLFVFHLGGVALAAFLALMVRNWPALRGAWNG